MLGLLVGDAAGAPLEFLSLGGQAQVEARMEARVDAAMRMGGGGSLNVAPGQGTDDSELAVHLLRSLVGKEPRAGFPDEAVAQGYIAWYHSNPFDIGRTCGSAFRDAMDAGDLRRNASRHNAKSQSNGALMRIAPLAIWAHGRVGKKELMDMAKTDACLSHPHSVCQDASAVYCVALMSLLECAGSSSERALQSLKATDVIIGDMHPDIQTWYAESATTRFEDFDVKINIGHVKHAFTLAFHFLRNPTTTFETAVAATCRKMGDSDTNCAIVGAMVGAMHGVDGIPSFMSGPVLAFDCVTHDPKVTLLGYNRPATYRAVDVMATLPLLHPRQEERMRQIPTYDSRHEA